MNGINICLQFKIHKPRTKNKQFRKFFVPPEKFTQVHLQGFGIESTRCLGSSRSAYMEHIVSVLAKHTHLEGKVLFALAKYHALEKTI